MRTWQREREERTGQSMIVDRDTDAPQGHREGIGARGALELAGAIGPELGFC